MVTDISVILPAYNAQNYIKHTIESLLRQSFIPCEILIIDDCSIDNTLDIVNEFVRNHPHIKVVRNDKNRGVSYSRNLGISLARAEWVLFMDADDIAEPQLVQLLVHRLTALTKEHPDKRWVLCHSAYQQIDENGDDIPGIIYGKQVMPDEIFGHELVRNQIISPSGLLACKETIQQLGGFNNDRKVNEDWELWLKIAQIGGFGYVDEPLVRIRRHPVNTTNQIGKSHKAEIEVLSQFDLLVMKKAILSRNLQMSRNYADYASLLYRLGHWDIGIKELLRIPPKDQIDGTLFNSGLYYLYKGDFNQAKEFFKRTIDMNPGHGAALNNLGSIFLLERSFEKARALFVSSLTLFPGFMDASHNLKLLTLGVVEKGDLKFTWRELRPSLIKYQA